MLIYSIKIAIKTILTVPTGIEPAIFAVTGRRDNRYTTGPYMGVNGIEPLTLCL